MKGLLLVSLVLTIGQVFCLKSHLPQLQPSIINDITLAGQCAINVTCVKESQQCDDMYVVVNQLFY